MLKISFTLPAQELFFTEHLGKRRKGAFLSHRYDLLCPSRCLSRSNTERRRAARGKWGGGGGECAERGSLAICRHGKPLYTCTKQL